MTTIYPGNSYKGWSGAQEYWNTHKAMKSCENCIHSWFLTKREKKQTNMSSQRSGEVIKNGLKRRKNNVE